MRDPLPVTGHIGRDRFDQQVEQEREPGRHQCRNCRRAVATDEHPAADHDRQPCEWDRKWHRTAELEAEHGGIAVLPKRPPGAHADIFDAIRECSERYRCYTTAPASY